MTSARHRRLFGVPLIPWLGGWECGAPSPGTGRVSIGIWILQSLFMHALPWGPRAARNVVESERLA